MKKPSCIGALLAPWRALERARTYEAPAGSRRTGARETGGRTGASRRGWPPERRRVRRVRWNVTSRRDYPIRSACTISAAAPRPRLGEDPGAERADRRLAGALLGADHVVGELRGHAAAEEP